MSTYEHLPGILTWETSWTTAFSVQIDSGSAVPITLALTDKHAYGESSAGVVTAGTLLDEIKTKIAAAFASGSPRITSSAASWVLGETPFPKWRLDLTLDTSATTVQIIQTGDALQEIGVRVLKVGSTHSASDQGGNVWRFESNGYTAGMWAPSVRCNVIPDEQSIVTVARSPFSPGDATKVLLGTRTDYDLTYDYVPAAMRSLYERNTFVSLETRAGLWSAVAVQDTQGALEQLLSAAAAHKGIRFHSAQGTLAEVDLDSEDLKLSAFASEATPGGIHYTVDLPLVEVA